MYKRIVRPVLFLFPPETVHKLAVLLVRIFLLIPGIRQILEAIHTMKDSSLEKEVLGLKFRNPVGLAAGFDKDARFYNEFSVFGFSFIEVGTITPLGQAGNPRPRSFRIPADKGLINRMGFNNMGADEALKQLKKRRTNIVIGGNIGKNTSTPNEQAVEDYAICFEKLYDYVDYFVVNVSCPNISHLSELQDKKLLGDILSRLAMIRSSRSLKKPVLVKISPDLNLNQIDDVLELIEKTGMDGIVATNTTILREGLKTPSSRINRIGQGGLSGAPVRERSTEIIRYIAQKTDGKLPIIGVGGIMSPEDAIDKLNAGASLVQVYTGFIYNGPGLVKRINRKLQKLN